MKLIHTADWHLGKLVHGVHMTEDQRAVLEQLIDAVRAERPDAVIIAGDLYDRAVPPTEAVELLDDVLKTIVVELETPVLAVAGNHDSPDRINFGSRIMQSRGLYLAGHLDGAWKPVVLRDEFGEVHFHLVPFADPAQLRLLLGDELIRTHDDAMKAVTDRIRSAMDPSARHIFVGHAFVTPMGEPKDNTSESERPLSIGGAEYVSSEHFKTFHYAALGHLHQAHHVADEKIRYAGSPLKYSISEEHHQKGYYLVELNGAGEVQTEKRLFKPVREMRRVEAYIADIESRHTVSDDYVFVTLLDDNPVLFPMEKVRAVYPNAMHVERKITLQPHSDDPSQTRAKRAGTDPVKLFASFYKEVKGTALSEEKLELFAGVFGKVMQEEAER